MSITAPTFYPQPWAANEQLVPLTPEEMAAGYPSGSEEKPSRQSINNALQYAVNGVLYWRATKASRHGRRLPYQMGSIVMYGGRYYASLYNDSVGQLPGSGAWVELLWLQSARDARYALLHGSVAFAACTVASSPGRTFANSPDGGGQGGMQWPPIGISVSTGTAWDTPIDPATLVTWPTAGIAVSTGTAWAAAIDPASLATWPGAGIPVSTGSAWGASINPATLATFPAAGVAVSAGSAWAAPIDPATLVLTTRDSSIAASVFIEGSVGAMGGGQLATVRIGNRGNPIVWQTGAPNINADADANLVLNASGVGSISLNFDQGTGGVHFGNGAGSVVASIDSQGHFAVLPNDGASHTIPTPGFGFALGWNVENQGRTNFINVKSAGVGGFSWYNVAANIPVTNQAALMTLDQNGGLAAAGFYSTGYVYAGGATSWGNMPTASIPSAAGARTLWRLHIRRCGQSLSTGACCAAATLADRGGNFKLNGFGPGGMTEINYLSVLDGLIQLNMNTHCYGGLTVDGTTTADTFSARVMSIYVGAAWYTDGGSTFFDGAPNGRLIINNGPGAGGYCAVNGSFTVVGTKTFSCPHPLDETQDLIHACLEGPENGVFYRGEVVLVDGAADVTLPDYFEPLVFEEDRSVLLTQVDDDKALAMLAAVAYRRREVTHSFERSRCYGRVGSEGSSAHRRRPPRGGSEQVHSAAAGKGELNGKLHTSRRNLPGHRRERRRERPCRPLMSARVRRRLRRRGLLQQTSTPAISTRRQG